jgi:hypothetical protein
VVNTTQSTAKTTATDATKATQALIAGYTNNDNYFKKTMIVPHDLLTNRGQT